MIYQVRWDEIQLAILGFERKGLVRQEEVDSLTSSERRNNIAANPFQVAHHFQKRVKNVFNFMKTGRSLGKYHVKDYFYRVEFQLRGGFNFYCLPVKCPGFGARKRDLNFII